MATINVQKRDGAGKGVARELRRNGMIPAVVYGAGKPNENLSISVKDFIRVMSGEGRNLLTNRQTLAGDGSEEVALVRAVQLNPVTDIPIHVDFWRYDPERVMQVSVPVEVSGMEESPGISRGGVLNEVRRRLTVTCKSKDIPQCIEISVEELDIGDSIHIEDITLPAGVTVRTDVNFTVTAVVGRQLEAVVDEEAEGDVEGEEETEETSEE